MQTTRERVKFVYRIKIDVKNPDRELKPGMPADAKSENPKSNEIPKKSDQKIPMTENRRLRQSV